MDKKRFRGIFPALYACYDDKGEVSGERTKNLCRHLFNKGILGFYVGGSSGECIYQSLDERKNTLRYVKESFGEDEKPTLIAHVGAPSTRDSARLAKYAEELGYDAVAAIPPIYFKMPESAIYKYWIEIVEASSLPFIMYNIPQTTGYSLSIDMFIKMASLEKVIGIKNSSLPAMDIERFKNIGGEGFIVYNGPDEQYISGRVIGADGGIGGTYGVMPELFLRAEKLVSSGDFFNARKIQNDINNVIFALFALQGNMYSGIKNILKLKGLNIGDVRGPMEQIHGEDFKTIEKIKDSIDLTIAKWAF
ncbi:MAG TPA: N-acetylneuraminate lyase [Clostridiales bacterium]|nr:N-acetylneuraminate lyase [Clostridiales bacterium]